MRWRRRCCPTSSPRPASCWSRPGAVPMGSSSPSECNITTRLRASVPWAGAQSPSVGERWHGVPCSLGSQSGVVGRSPMLVRGCCLVWALHLLEDPHGGAGRGQPRLGLQCGFLTTGWQHRITLRIERAGGFGAWIPCVVECQAGGTASIEGPHAVPWAFGALSAPGAGARAGAHLEEPLPLPLSAPVPYPRAAWQHSVINSGSVMVGSGRRHSLSGAHGAGWPSRGAGRSAQA